MFKDQFLTRVRQCTKRYSHSNFYSMRTMKRTTVTTLVANLRRAIARCLDRISGKATRTDSRSRGTSRIGELATTGALCPDVTEMTVRKQRLTPTLRSLFLSLRGVKRRGNPVGKATTGRNPLDCRVGPLGLLAMTIDDIDHSSAMLFRTEKAFFPRPRASAT